MLPSSLGLDQPVEVFTGSRLEIDKSFARIATIVFGYTGAVSPSRFGLKNLFRPCQCVGLRGNNLTNRFGFGNADR